MDTTILVDIDGVLARHNTRSLFRIYNKILSLGIPDDVFIRVRTREAFDALPEAQVHLARVGVRRYQYQLDALEWHPHYVFENKVIDGAANGVRYLAERSGTLKYCTARVINFDEQWNMHLARITHIWLQNNGFPYHDQVLFCDGIPAKLTAIAAMMRNREQSVLLIDDSAKNLIEAFKGLSQDDQDILREYLTLAAFGYDECDGNYPIPVIPFPGWNEVHNLAVEKEFDYAEKQRRQG